MTGRAYPYSKRFQEAEAGAEAHFKDPHEGMFRPSTTVDGDVLTVDPGCNCKRISEVTSEVEGDQVVVSSVRTGDDSNFYPEERLIEPMDEAIKSLSADELLALGEYYASFR